MKIFLVCCIIITLDAAAQKKPVVRNIAFEGAGIRGIAYCGVIQALKEDHLLDSIQRVCGTSAGAIIALTLSLGYGEEEIKRLISSTSFNNLNDGKHFFPGGLNRLRKYYGWYKGERFEKWISKIIAVKTGNPEITFGQLHQMGFKDLYITGTNLTRQQLAVFSNEHYPRMKVRDAVRISMSIPFYFKAVFMDSVGNLHTRVRKDEDLNVMLDGGFIANYPIKMFDSTKYTDAKVPNNFTVNNETIGFRIDSKAQVAHDQQRKGLAEMKITNLKEYFKAFYTIIIESLNRQTLTEEDWQRTVSINDGNIGPRLRKLSKEEVTRLIDNGYQAAKQFFRSP